MRIGSLFSGYGGLDLAVEQVTGATPAWFVEYEAAPSRILAHQWPDVPNHGDVTTVDWTAVEPVDVITGGFPCQDVSHAGRRAGLIRSGVGATRSGLWGHMLRAIDTLRPSLVVAENVRGLLSARADSDMEPCPWCMGGAGDGQPPLRALGALLGDLADVGFDAAWLGLRAADVGAPHGRFRVFIVAWPATDADVSGREGPQPAARRHVSDRGAVEGLTLLPTPRATDGTKGGPNQRGSSGDLMLPSAVALLPTPRATRGGSATETTALLPTPAVNDMGAGKTVEAWDEWTARMQATHANGNGHGASLHIEALRLMPTPSVADVEGGRKHRSGARSDELLLNGIAAAERWGDYAPAIARWEHVLGRPAPDPTEPTGRDGAHRLSARFVEWMMGLPDGWVTGVPGVTRNHALKALGNGVVPQQAAAALTYLFDAASAEGVSA